jgi:hypothetical protein
MAEQEHIVPALVARRTLLVCRTCGGEIWHFDVQEVPSAESPVMLIGYRCDGCGARVSMSVLAPAAEADRAGS